MKQLKPIFERMDAAQAEQAKFEQRKRDAQAGIGNLEAKVAELQQQFEALDKVTASERVEALIKGLGTANTKETAEKKIQQKAILNQQIADLRRDIGLLRDEVSKCEAASKEFGDELNELQGQVLKAIHDDLCEAFMRRAKDFVMESVVPLAAISSVLGTWANQNGIHHTSLNSRSQRLLDNISIAVIENGVMKKLVGQIGGPSLGLISKEATKDFAPERYPELVGEMINQARHDPA